ncbi:transposase [Frankia sp. Hr75.2]|nr:transposase [Frankia sp. Hr75.2]
MWRFRTGGQWREMPAEFGAWPTVHNRFRQWRDAGVFEALLEGMVAEAAKRGEVDLSLVSVDSTTARAHHDAAGMHLAEDVIAALEKAATEEEKTRQKGRHAGTKRAERRGRPRAGRTATPPAPTQGPADRCSARTVAVGCQKSAWARELG